MREQTYISIVKNKNSVYTCNGVLWDVKKNEIITFLGKGIKLAFIFLSEINMSEVDKQRFFLSSVKSMFMYIVCICIWECVGHTLEGGDEGKS